ncbi:hypothetical protein [Haladaptatus salinisoli]|uniref:hypothetical protein n=1 Tax=Haladaptatus salinisoli TaxID=2884876 RepID=UPI001D0B7776|nr:hypothetical protein [Haladaptatus salinisoli]
MNEIDADELVEFALDRSGNSLRGIACYSEDAFELTYRREDIPAGELRQRIDEIIHIFFHRIQMSRGWNITDS